MEILSKLPFDLQEHILVKVMKRYKLRDGEYVRQIDKSKYAFLDYIMRPSINKNSFHYHEDIFQDIIIENIKTIHISYQNREDIQHTKIINRVIKKLDKNITDKIVLNVTELVIR